MRRLPDRPGIPKTEGPAEIVPRQGRCQCSLHIAQPRYRNCRRPDYHPGRPSRHPERPRRRCPPRHPDLQTGQRPLRSSAGRRGQGRQWRIPHLPVRTRLCPNSQCCAGATRRNMRSPSSTMHPRTMPRRDQIAVQTSNSPLPCGSSSRRPFSGRDASERKHCRRWCSERENTSPLRDHTTSAQRDEAASEERAEARRISSNTRRSVGPAYGGRWRPAARCGRRPPCRNGCGRRRRRRPLDHRWTR